MSHTRHRVAHGARRRSRPAATRETDRALRRAAPAASAARPAPARSRSRSSSEPAPGQHRGAFQAFDAQVPSSRRPTRIDIEPHEYEWTGPTFAAMLAGGTLPDVFTIPFTDGRSLIAEQAARGHHDARQGAAATASSSTPTSSPRPGRRGQDLRRPAAGLRQSLQYNRQLFEQAGLDPDKPPTTWDEVRTRPSRSPRRPARPATSRWPENTGGWQTTSPPTRVAAGWRRSTRTAASPRRSTTRGPRPPSSSSRRCAGRTTRWARNSCTTGAPSTRRSRPARSACTPAAPTSTPTWSRRQIDPAVYGLTTIPLDDDPNAGVLAAATSPRSTSSPPREAAAVKWIDFYYMQKLLTRKPRSLDAADPRGRRAAGGHPRDADLRPGHLRAVGGVDQGLHQRPARPDDRLHRRSSSSRSSPSRASTPRRCTPSWTPWCRPC